MDRSDFVKHMQRLLSEVESMSATKGREYAPDSDALANFKKRGEEMGISPMQAWGVLFGKHYDAIHSYIRSERVLSEPISGRIKDAILYLVLLDALIEEPKTTQSPSKIQITYGDHG